MQVRPRLQQRLSLQASRAEPPEHLHLLPALSGGRDAISPALKWLLIATLSLASLRLQEQGYIDESGKLRKIPFEVMVRGDKLPVYSETLEDNGRFNEVCPCCMQSSVSAAVSGLPAPDKHPCCL